MTQRKCLIFGDVHGCYDELRRLLDKCKFSDADRVISLGDIVDRGPKTRECVDFFMRRDKPDERSAVMGNHEERLLKYAAKSMLIGYDKIEWRADYHKVSFDALKAKHFEWFGSLPKFMRLPEYTAPDGKPVTLVHAGCVPDVPLEEQSDMILMHATHIEPPAVGGVNLDGTKNWGYWTGQERIAWTSKAPAHYKFWSSIYDGSNGHVLFGHAGFDDVARFPHATGLDTGACFGRKLTALILPDWQVVQVDALAAYKQTKRVKQYEVYPGIMVHS